MRDYRTMLAESRVPMFVSHGLLPLSEGHILQIKGLYTSRKPRTTRMVLGQWGHHITPDGFTAQAVAWFDHYLRNGPMKVKPGVVEYQDESGSWHSTDTWPPDSNQRTIYLSDRALVDGKNEVRQSTQRFQSKETDPGLSPERCGGQALYASAPLKNDIRVAGNATIEVTLTSTQPGGYFAGFLFHTPGRGRCPDPNVHGQESGPDDFIGRRPLEFNRTLANLRHWKVQGTAKPFPILTPTPVSFESVPFATKIPAGERIVLAIGGGATQLASSKFKPTLTVTTGQDTTGNVQLPIVDGKLAFSQSKPSIGRPKRKS